MDRQTLVEGLEDGQVAGREAGSSPGGDGPSTDRFLLLPLRVTEMEAFFSLLTIPISVGPHTQVLNK